jgi:hypothetical protein
MISELMASPTDPMPAETRRHQLTRMWQGLRALELDEKPTTDDWRICSDAVNLLETLIGDGVVQDASGLLNDAVAALATAGKRHMQGQRLGLSGSGIQTIRAVLEDYEMCLNSLPARTMIRAHRKTEARIRDILSGRRKPHDVEVMAI